MIFYNTITCLSGLSSKKPVNPKLRTRYFETDTGRLLIWVGSEWILLANWEV